MIWWLSSGRVIWNYGDIFNTFGAVCPPIGGKIQPWAQRGCGCRGRILCFASPRRFKPLCGLGYQRSAVALRRDQVRVEQAINRAQGLMRGSVDSVACDLDLNVWPISGAVL